MSRLRTAIAALSLLSGTAFAQLIVVNPMASKTKEKEALIAKLRMPRPRTFTVELEKK